MQLGGKYEFDFSKIRAGKCISFSKLREVGYLSLLLCGNC